MSQTPSIGRIVHYKLNAGDVGRIQQKREQLRAAGLVWSSLGNPVSVGEVYPAEIVRVWGQTPQSSVNLQVKLDGPDTHWVTSASHADFVGGENDAHPERTYIWPPRV